MASWGSRAVSWQAEICEKVAAPRKQNGATRPAKLEVLLKAKAREAGLEPQAVARRGKSRTIGEVRRGFIEVAVLEQGYQASAVARFLECHASNVSRALLKRGSKL
jgi:ActR/RegA family two-component response regulator